MPTEVRVDLAKLDPEPSNLDLVVRPPRALDHPIRPVPPQIPRTVHAVPHAAPVRRPRLPTARDGVNAVNARTEPVFDKLLGGRFGELEVPLGEATGAHVDLADFADGAELVLVVAVHDEELDVDHPRAGGHDVLAGLEEGGVGCEGRDGEVGTGKRGAVSFGSSSGQRRGLHGALGLGRSEHVDDLDVVGELLEAGAVTLGEDVADEERVEERGDRARRLRREELAHGCRAGLRQLRFLEWREKDTDQG